MNTHAERAAALYCDNFNCAQAVATAFADLTGLEEDVSKRLASSFGGGIDNKRFICGSLTGALIVLGALRGFTDPTGGNKRAHTARATKLVDAFRTEFEFVECGDLRRRNERDGSAAAEAKPCLKYVLGAVRLVENFLEGEEETHD